MSNATENTGPSTGPSRRRRSRGGQNRRNNDQSERKNQGPSNKKEGSYSSQQQGNRKPQSRKLPKRAPLTWWQRLLKAVGLFKEPVRPPRPERKDLNKAASEPKKAKVRDARSAQNTEANDAVPRNPKNSRAEGKSGRSRGGDVSTVENRRVYVGNLSYDTTENDLEELFKGVGAVRRVEIVYNRNTHRSKGYGFIEMLDIDEAKRTVEVLHDQFFMGRKLTVSGAKSQDYKEAEETETANVANLVPELAPLPAVSKAEESLEIVVENRVEEIQPEIAAKEIEIEAEKPAEALQA